MAMIPETTKRMVDAARLAMKYCQQWKFQDDEDNPMDAGQLEYGCGESDAVDLPDEDDDECFYYVSPDGAIGRTDDNGESIEWLILPMTRTMASMPQRLIKGEPWPEEIPAPVQRQAVSREQETPGLGKGVAVGFCPSCGKPLTANDRFCENCGTSVADRMGEVMAQSAAPQAQGAQAMPRDSGEHKLSVRAASIICYLFSFVGWVICYFLADNKNDYLRFHLNQSLVLCLLEVVVYALRRIPFVSTVLDIAVFVLWLIAIIGAIRNEKRTAPLLDKIPTILK